MKTLTIQNAKGNRTHSRLQFDRFNFGDESLVVVGEERTDHVEHGVTEATNVHNVSSRSKVSGTVYRHLGIALLFFMDHGTTKESDNV